MNIKKYYVSGMHCNACKVLIKNKIKEDFKIKDIDFVEKDSSLVLKSKNDIPNLDLLNDSFKDEDYSFSDTAKKKKTLIPWIIAVSLILVFFVFFNLSPESYSLDLDSDSSLYLFALLGLMAGFSTCAALLGGLILSVTDKWLKNYSSNDSFIHKAQPHIMFNIGRLISFLFFGALIGLLGSRLNISIEGTSILVIVVSIVMLFLGLQMLGLKYFNNINIKMPKILSDYFEGKSKVKSKYLPFVMGFLSFFLPCGFTVTAQVIALMSADPVSASLIMFFFALGTMPPLLIISFSSIKILENKEYKKVFLKIAGSLVIIFAVYSFNSQLNLMGLSSLNDLKLKKDDNVQKIVYVDDFEIDEDGFQVIEMEVYGFKYVPNRFYVKKDVPVRWKIEDISMSGCTNALIAPDFFEGEFRLEPKSVIIKEFTPDTLGVFKFSCWMGMVTGTIEVIE